MGGVGGDGSNAIALMRAFITQSATSQHLI